MAGMPDWLDSVYSDGTAAFVSDPAPRLNGTVTIRLRMYADAPVRHVVLRLLRNGAENLEEMRPGETLRGLTYWETALRISEPRMQYHFCLICEDAVYYYNQKEVTAYMPNRDYDFRLLTDYAPPAWVKEAVFYQIFPERFCNGDPDNDVRDGEYSQDGFPAIRRNWDDVPLSYEEGRCLDFHGGDLQGIRQKIPYLKELGVTALYLNPIFTAPSVHKYDCVDYLHVDPHFGGDEALAELSAALHENGMRLILDISVNHTGVNHRWFNRDGQWFPKSAGAYNNPDAPERAYYFLSENNDYLCWWNVPTMPTLNYTSDALREAVWRGEDSVLKKWLKPPWSIDGWRFDVADVLGRQDGLQLSHEIWPEIRKSIRAVNPEAYILAEDWGDCCEHLTGDEWDAPMNYYGCGRPIRQFAGEPERFMGQKGLLDGLSVRMTAEELKAQVTEYLGKLPQGIRDSQFNLFDSHDVTRLHNNPSVHPGDWRGAVIFQFILPGAASVYYGDEAAIDGRPGSNEGCRYPMPWGRDFKKSENWRLYSALAHLKAAHPALSRGGMKFLYAAKRVIAIARFDGDEAYAAVISMAARRVTVRLPLAVIGAAAPEDSDVTGAPLDWEPCGPRAVTLRVPAHTAYLFRCRMRED